MRGGGAGAVCELKRFLDYIETNPQLNIYLFLVKFERRGLARSVFDPLQFCVCVCEG